MLLQTNSYLVPREKRAEHARLLRRFRQVLARIGCDNFEVYEQVGSNWTSGEPTGRYVQIMRFRDRRHQLAVQAAERNDPVAQALIAEFCQLINFPYQQQQGLFAIGFYNSILVPNPARQQPGEPAAPPAEEAPAPAAPADAQPETPRAEESPIPEAAPVPEEELATEQPLPPPEGEGNGAAPVAATSDEALLPEPSTLEGQGENEVGQISQSDLNALLDAHLGEEERRPGHANGEPGHGREDEKYVRFVEPESPGEDHPGETADNGERAHDTPLHRTEPEPDRNHVSP